MEWREYGFKPGYNEELIRGQVTNWSLLLVIEWNGVLTWVLESLPGPPLEEHTGELGLVVNNIGLPQEIRQNIGAYHGARDNPYARWMVTTRSQSVNMAENVSNNQHNQCNQHN